MRAKRRPLSTIIREQWKNLRTSVEELKKRGISKLHALLMDVPGKGRGE